MELNKQIAHMAKEAGICCPGFKRILATGDISGLLQYYRAGIDFCLSNDFPPLPVLREHAGAAAKHGIYVDADGVLADNADFVVLLGNSSGAISANGHQVSEVFVKHRSVVRVVAEDSAFVVIDCFDDSVVNVHASGKARVLVSVYGRSVVHVNGKGVKVVHKERETY